MNTNPSLARTNNQAATTRGVIKRFVQVALSLLLLAAVLFIAAGRLDWWMAWAYIGLYVGNVAINALVLLPKNPELIAERGKTKVNAKSWDRMLGFFITIAMLAMLIVAGL